jgi:hypothetical protein
MMTAAGPMSTAVPVGQAQQAMQQFGGGNPMQAGSGIMATGLDVPGMDTTAAAMPGTPGHAATNVIDQQGGLDPRGLTVDGNNAAGLLQSLRVAEWLKRPNLAAGSADHPRACSLVSTPTWCTPMIQAGTFQPWDELLAIKGRTRPDFVMVNDVHAMWRPDLGPSPPDDVEARMALDRASNEFLGGRVVSCRISEGGLHLW